MPAPIHHRGPTLATATGLSMAGVTAAFGWILLLDLRLYGTLPDPRLLPTQPLATTRRPAGPPPGPQRRSTRDAPATRPNGEPCHPALEGSESRARHTEGRTPMAHVLRTLSKWLIIVTIALAALTAAAVVWLLDREGLAAESEPAHEAVKRRGQHVLVRCPRVAAALACERDPVAADHGDPFAVLGVHEVDGHLVVRVFRPDARAVTVQDRTAVNVIRTLDGDVGRISPETGQFIKMSMASMPQPETAAVPLVVAGADITDLTITAGTGGTVEGTFHDVEITTKIYERHPVLIHHGPNGGNPWVITFRQGLFNMASDSGLFRTADELRRGPPSGTTIETVGEFCEIQGDEVLLRQMFSNLVRNAAEACQIAGIRPEIVIQGTADTARGVCRVTVADNGPGIPDGDRDRVFQPFFTTRSRGTGLGLALVQKIVVMHNGRVEAGKSPAGGASIELTFPVTAPRASP